MGTVISVIEEGQEKGKPYKYITLQTKKESKGMGRGAPETDVVMDWENRNYKEGEMFCYPCAVKGKVFNGQAQISYARMKDDQVKPEIAAFCANVRKEGQKATASSGVK
jgi:hypothetical protein